MDGTWPTIRAWEHTSTSPTWDSTLQGPVDSIFFGKLDLDSEKGGETVGGEQLSFRAVSKDGAFA